MTDGTLPFSHTDYDKLTHAVFPTLRRRDKYGSVGDVNEIMVGSKGNRESWGKAEIVAKETVTLAELPDALLMWDTESSTPPEAIKSINKFYRNDIQPQEEITLYWNRWVNRSKEHGQ
jgi:hypothetical protein